MKKRKSCNEYEQGGLKNVYIFSKITNLQCSWVKRLYDDSFHAWKVTPLFLIKNHLGKNFVFHSNLSIKQNVIKNFPKLYQEILIRWGKYLSSTLNVLSAVACQFIWYNEYIKIDNNTIYNYYFSQKKVSHIGDLFENNGKIRCWEDLRAKFGWQ